MSNEHDNIGSTGEPRSSGETEAQAGPRVSRVSRVSSDAQAGAGAGADVGGHLPPTDRVELAALLRDLDDVGARRRAQLSSEAEERIFAASDLQLPLSHGEVRPVAGRIVPLRSNALPAWVRIAAAIAVVGSIAAGALVLSRSLSGTPQDGSPSGRMLADSETNSSTIPASSGASSGASFEARSGTPTALPQHFDLALATDPLLRASSLPAPTVVAALESPKRLAYPAIARLDSAVLASSAVGSMADVGLHDDSLGGVGGINDAIDLDFDGLSGEFAAIVSRSASSL